MRRAADAPDRARGFDMICHNATHEPPSCLTLSDVQSAVKIGYGTATAEEIGQLLLEFSTLYRILGGSGITFTKTDARELAFA